MTSRSWRTVKREKSITGPLIPGRYCLGLVGPAGFKLGRPISSHLPSSSLPADSQSARGGFSDRAFYRIEDIANSGSKPCPYGRNPRWRRKFGHNCRGL